MDNLSPVALLSSRPAGPGGGATFVRAGPDVCYWASLVACGALVIALFARSIGFSDGILLGATASSGLALSAAVLLRWPGALAASLGIGAAAWAAGLPTVWALIDGGAHGLAALSGAATMRALARRSPMRNRTTEWFGFFAGVTVFAATVAGVFFAAVAAGLLPDTTRPMLALVFEPFGLMVVGAVLFCLREWRTVVARPGPAFTTALLGAIQVGVWYWVIQSSFGFERLAGITLIMAAPFCLWVTMQRRSLDGAVVSFVAANVSLYLLLRETGATDNEDFVTTIGLLSVLIGLCQLVHAVNLDRLGAQALIERQARELEARVTERTARLAAASEAALAADAAKTRFVAMVSHEMRTPLNGVLGMTALVLESPLDPQVRRNVEVIRMSGKHLLDVIDRLLDFTRLDRPVQESDLGDFDLRELVGDVLAEARALPYAQDLDLRARIEPGLPTLRRGYRQGVRQVLTNLVGNAAKFTDRGSVTIRCRSLPGTGVRIEVEDTGIGLSAAVQDRVFLPYQRADEASDGRFGGAGLGLAICADMVRRLGGTIGVQSAPGAGATFWFELQMEPVAQHSSLRAVKHVHP